MKIGVYVAATLRGFVNRNERIEAEGETIADILQNVTDEYTEIKKALFDENGELRAFVGVYLNDKNVTEQAKWQTQPKEGDLLLLLPVIAGGGRSGNDRSG